MNKISLLFLGLVFAAHAVFAGEPVTASTLYHTDQQAFWMAAKLDEAMQLKLDIAATENELAEIQAMKSRFNNRTSEKTKSKYNFRESSLTTTLDNLKEGLEIKVKSIKDDVVRYTEYFTPIKEYKAEANVVKTVRALIKKENTDEINQIKETGGAAVRIAAALNEEN